MGLGTTVMKVLARANHGKYICEIEVNELAKFLNRYRYGNGNSNKLTELAIGQEFDLAMGYDFAVATKKSLDGTKAFIEKHDETIKALMNGIQVIAHLGDDND